MINCFTLEGARRDLFDLFDLSTQGTSPEKVTVPQFLVFFTETEDYQILQLDNSWPTKHSASITSKQKYFLTN